MIYKIRIKPESLVKKEYLARRMTFSKEEYDDLIYRLKGFAGECSWDALTIQLACDCLILNDLHLEHSGNSFQIDCLLLVGKKIYLCEIKNYEGDYFYEDSKLYTRSKLEVRNPFTKVSETASSLRRLLKDLGFSYPIEEAVIFINPSFVLYQAPLDLPVLFAGQLPKHFQKLNRVTAPISQDQKHLADKLTKRHIVNSRHETQPPAYCYAKLRKGLTCSGCGSFSLFEKGHYCHCDSCGQKERTSAAVLRGVAEFRLLFPKEKITTQVMHEWCQVIQSLRTIREILKTNFVSAGSLSGTYYQ